MLEAKGCHEGGVLQEEVIVRLLLEECLDLLRQCLLVQKREILIASDINPLKKNRK